MAALEVVVWDKGAKMMNMVISYASCKPVQQPGSLKRELPSRAIVL